PLFLETCLMKSGKNFRFALRKAAIASLGVIIFFGPIIYFTLQQPHKAEAAWFNDSWAYRQAITATVTSSSSDTTNLDTLITVNTSALISSKLQSSCQDLRFTNQAGVQLPYYIDSGCNTTTTKIWVRVDLVPKNTTTYTMYMYYGNPSAVAATDPITFWAYKNLVGYWTQNESSWNGTANEVKDASPQGNNAFAQCSGGGCSVPSTTTGKFSNGGSFSKTGSVEKHVNIPPSATTEPGTGDWTTSIWVNISSLNSPSNNTRLLYKVAAFAPTDNGYYLAIETSPHFWWHIGDGSNAVEVYSTSTPTTGTWYHVVGTWVNSTHTASLYVNGVLESSGT